MTADKIRCALYARCSTNTQHPQSQIENLRHFADQRGWEIAGEYVDHGQSGAKDQRPELDRLMADVRRGRPRINVVLVERFDRFARSVRHLVTALEEFRCRNVDFTSKEDGVDTTTVAGRFGFHLIAALAEMEREITRSRVRSSLQSAKRRGVRLGRPRADFDLDRAIELRAQGNSYRAIGRALGVGASTVHKALREHEEGAVHETPPQSADPGPEIAGESDAA